MVDRREGRTKKGVERKESWPRGIQGGYGAGAGDGGEVGGGHPSGRRGLPPRPVRPQRRRHPARKTTRAPQRVGVGVGVPLLSGAGWPPRPVRPQRRRHPARKTTRAAYGGYPSGRRGLPPRPVRPQRRRHPARKTTRASHRVGVGVGVTLLNGATYHPPPHLPAYHPTDLRTNRPTLPLMMVKRSAEASPRPKACASRSRAEPKPKASRSQSRAEAEGMRPPSGGCPRPLHDEVRQAPDMAQPRRNRLMNSGASKQHSYSIHAEVVVRGLVCNRKLFGLPFLDNVC